MAALSSNVSGNNLDVDPEANSLDAKFVENLRIEEETTGNNVANGESSIMQGEDKVHVISSGGTNNTGSMSRNDSYELRQDVMSEKRKRLDSNKDLSGSTSTIQKDEKCSKALAFSIPIDTCLPSRQPPKRLCNAKKTGKASIEILNKKQALAEERRQCYKENRLKRMHERQEACRKLAQNVDTLLQQRALAQGTANGGVKHMPASELLATARLVSQNFRALTNQLGNDLTVKDDGREKMCKECQGENQNARVHCVQKKFPSSVSFTVQCDSGKSPVKPKLAIKQQQQGNKRTLTAGDIEEKLRKAEERRNKRKELRSQRARENREALLAMAIDLEKFKELQSATTSASQDNCENLAEQNKEAAILAKRLADQFDRLNKRYSDDLQRAENFQVVHPSVYHWIPKGFME